MNSQLGNIEQFKLTERLHWPTTPGIYGIWCLENNKYYIGHTLGKEGVKGRCSTHSNASNTTTILI
jgi:hypothetical protein